MSINLSVHHVQQYSNTVALLVQQYGSRLRGKVMEGVHIGKAASPLNQVGPVVANKVTSRFQPQGRQDAAMDRRWVFPSDYATPQLIDPKDELRMITDPKSAYVANGVNAMGRAQDDEIISGVFGTNKTDETGSTSTVFLTGNVVGVNTGGTASDLNVDKLLTGLQLLMSYDYDLDREEVWCAITSKQHRALLSQAQVTSGDYTRQFVLERGRVMQFAGINFVMCNRLTTGTDDQAGTSRQVPMWIKSRVYLGIWSDTQSKIAQRADLQMTPWQVETCGTFGATRLEEKGVVKMWCRES